MDPSPRDTRAGAAGVLFGFTAAVLTVIGSFQLLVDVQQNSIHFTVSSWAVRAYSTPSGAEVEAGFAEPLNGVPLVAAAAVLLAALLVVALPGSERVRRRAGMIAVLSVAFLAATVFGAALEQRWWLDTFEPPLSSRVPGTAEYSERGGPALWTLFMAVGLAALAAVVGWRMSRSPVARVEPDTPVLGVPEAAGVHRLPDLPADEGAAVVHRLPDLPADEPDHR